MAGQMTTIHLWVNNKCYAALHLLVLPYILYGEPLCRVILQHS